MQITPTFLLSLIPMPIMLVLNLVIFLKLHQVKRLSNHHKIRMSSIYRRGVMVNAVAFAVFLIPAIAEMRIFVINPNWLYVYMLSGILTIIGQTMVIRGLNAELVKLLRRLQKNRRTKATKPSISARQTKS